MNLAHFAPGASGQLWRYSSAKLDAIVPQSDAPVVDGNVSTTFPANSITLLVIPPASAPVPKPVVAAVTNAASYATAIAPGQMVIVWGSGMGPEKLGGLKQDNNGLVSTSVDNVRILFDGIPAPLVYVSATQSSAVVSYFGAAKPVTHVQVEYQGVRSDPLEVPIVATGPGLFTANATGAGQGSILNEDGVTKNFASAPAMPGSVIILYGTREGLTDPPGVDGRLAIDVLPKRVAAVSVEIGGLPAAVEYAGAAPYTMPGMFQINARMSSNVDSGDHTPVVVKIGGRVSQDGVTVAVR